MKLYISLLINNYYNCKLLKIKTIVLYVAVILMFVLLVFGYVWYRKTFLPNTRFDTEEAYIYIPTNSNYEQVKLILTAYVDDMDSFDDLATQMGYAHEIFPGKFLLQKGMSNFQ